MGKAKIVVTGNVQKPPKFNKDGTVDLLFKASMSPNVPKGLQSLGDSLILVHVAPKTWRKIADTIKENSFYIIQGEPKAQKSSKDIPFMEVVAFDISVKEPSEKEKEKPNVEVTSNKDLKVIPVKTEPNKKVPPKKNIRPRKKRIQWYTQEDIVFIPTSSLIMSERIHQNTSELLLGRVLKYAIDNGQIPHPLAVKVLDQNKYSLVMGMVGYTVAKILNLEKIPVVLTELNHKELGEKIFQVVEG